MPHAATSGARMSETLSPTPPVECLSMRGTVRWERSSMRPLSSIAVVRASISSSAMPRKYTAIASADIW